MLTPADIIDHEPCCSIGDAISTIVSLSLPPSTVLAIASEFRDAGDDLSAEAWAIALAVLVSS